MTTNMHATIIIDKRRFQQLTTQELTLLKKNSVEVICRDCRFSSAHVISNSLSGVYKEVNCGRCRGTGFLTRADIERLICGRKLSLKRIASGKSIYEHSKENNVSPRQVFLKENGFL